MSGPRNLVAFQRSQDTRDAIRAFLSGYPPLLPPPTADLVCERLELSVSVRTVRWHMRAIRLEALAEVRDTLVRLPA